MPMLMRYVSEIVAERKADTLLAKFRAPEGRFLRRASDNVDAVTILDWLQARNITYELTCPAGHLEGYTGLYAIYFASLRHPLYLEFLKEFETPSGESLKPESYVLMIAQYNSERSGTPGASRD